MRGRVIVAYDENRDVASDTELAAWVDQGFDDPGEIAAWLTFGVQNASIAADAVSVGYIPGDPWVTPCPPSIPTRTRVLHRPSPRAAWQNRRRARIVWAEQQRIAAQHRAEVDATVALSQPVEINHLATVRTKGPQHCSEQEIRDALTQLIAETSRQANGVDAELVTYWRDMLELLSQATATIGRHTMRHHLALHLFETSSRVDEWADRIHYRR